MKRRETRGHGDAAISVLLAASPCLPLPASLRFILHHPSLVSYGNDKHEA
ncbi:MAG: hypothetical protein ACR2LZ_02845 [Pyrinomonadaceae bacterium]